MGHGGGCEILNKKHFNQVHNLKNIIILMGCRSASLINKKNLFDLRNNFKGVLIEYLTSDSSFVIGNLWSITDKDADLMTIDILNKLDKVSKTRDIKILAQIL